MSRLNSDCSSVVWDMDPLSLFIDWHSYQQNNMLEYYESPHGKTNKVTVRPAKTQISLGIRPVWSESSLSARRKTGSLAIDRAHSEDSVQTGRMPRLILVFAGRTLILLVLSCRGFYNLLRYKTYYEIWLPFRRYLLWGWGRGIWMRIKCPVSMK